MRKVLYLLFCLFTLRVFSVEILNISFDENALLMGRVKDKAGPEFSYADIKGSDVKIEKIGNLQGLRFERKNRTHILFVKSNEMVSDFSNGLVIEIKFLYTPAEESGIGTLFSKYEIKKPRRTFSLHLMEKNKKAAIGFTISPDGKTTENAGTGYILESGKIYDLKVVFIPEKKIEIYVDGKLAGEKKTELKKLFKSNAPVAIGCRFYGPSPINLFNGVIFNLKVSTLTSNSLNNETVSLPDFVNWNYEGAYQKDNGLRGKIVLNGWWRWYPAGKEENPPSKVEWYYRKVPGIGKWFFVKDSQGKRITKIDEKEITGYEKAWIEREFKIPENWKNRRVFISVMNTKGGGIAFLNGKKIGALLQNLPWKYEIKKPFKNKYKLTILTEGIIDNVWLESFPEKGYVQEIFLIPSFRNKNIEVKGNIENSDKKPFDLKISFFFSDKKEKEITIKNVKDNFSEKFGWKNPKLWSYEHPNLYTYTCQIIRKGKIIDETFPEKFGFREFWIDDGHFYLNGKLITLRSDSNVPFTMRVTGTLNRMGVLGNEKYIRNIIAGWKNLGLNSFHIFSGGDFLNPDILLNVCDEMGYYVQVMLPNYLNYFQFYQNKDIRKYIEDSLASIVKRLRNHPSVLFYFETSGSNVWDYCPAKLDGSYDPDKIWGKVEEYEILKKIIDKYDGTRPVSYYSGGARGPIHTTMGYINYDADLQVHENWPLKWYKCPKKPRPVLPTEFSLPYPACDYLRPTRSAHSFEKPIWMEWAAVYFGEEPLKEILKEKEKYGKEKVPGQSKEIYDKLHALFTKYVLRAWRTYGISFAFHAEVRRFFKSLQKPEVLKIDPRVPFYVSDVQVSEGDPFVNSPLSRAGIEAKKALSPFLAYIGGPDGRFTLKDHTYFSEEIVKKAIVFVNDYEENVEVSGKWKLKDINGKTILEKNFRTILNPGERKVNEIKIEFKAPEVKKRTDYIIEMEAIPTKGEKQEDNFKISVFPHIKPPVLTSKIYLYDPVGDTEKLLKKASVKFEKIYKEIPEKGILVIGRKALSEKNSFYTLASWKTNLGYGIDNAIERGLKVLIFEQPMENILGLKAEERCWRHAFITSANHPVLKGLKDEDFSYLKGDSNLTPAYPDPKTPPELPYAHPERFWKWGNDNVVSTFPIFKPQVGSFRALLSCGFELGESPLIEFTKGSGRIIFCQVDVTNRYGIDPVSTILVNNLLSYLDKVPQPDPSMPEPVNLLQEPEKGFVLTKYKDYIFPLEKPVWGITLYDVYMREYLDLKTIKNGKNHLLLTEKNGKFYHILSLYQFKTRWQRMKSLRILSALRINQGGSSNEGPAFTLQGDNFSLYPINWLEGFVNPYLHWRW